jgi:hypothetical protein
MFRTGYYLHPFGESKSNSLTKGSWGSPEELCERLMLSLRLGLNILTFDTFVGMLPERFRVNRVCASLIL